MTLILKMRSRDTSTSSQVSNCNGVVLEIYLEIWLEVEVSQHINQLKWSSNEVQMEKVFFSMSKKTYLPHC